MGDTFVRQYSELSILRNFGCICYTRLNQASETKMFTKILLFFLIAGVFAEDPIVEREEDDDEFDSDLAESEDYDEVDEVDEDEEERDLSDDMQMLDSDSMNEVKAFCAAPANAADPVCSVPM